MSASLCAVGPFGRRACRSAYACSRPKKFATRLPYDQRQIELDPAEIWGSLVANFSGSLALPTAPMRSSRSLS